MSRRLKKEKELRKRFLKRMNLVRKKTLKTQRSPSSRSMRLC